MTGGEFVLAEPAFQLAGRAFDPQMEVAGRDIGMAALADLDLGDHVPDQLQINLGDAYAGVLAGAGQGQRHIRFGLPPKIDGAVIDLVGDSLRKFWLFREIEAAVNGIHGKPRNPQTFLARRIHLRQFGDRRHLPQ
mgnify:CR=1 FL=1